MNCLLKWVCNFMAIIGGIMVFGAVGTSDYYTLELGQKEPSYIWWVIAIGFLLTIPLIVRMVIKRRMEK